MLTGRNVSHYRVLHRIGVGGMGEVYEAEDVRLLRRVAMKFLHQDAGVDPDATRRLMREAKTSALLSHPHICTIHEVGNYRGRLFIVMERLEGRPLSAYMEGISFDTDQILEIAWQVGDALAHAHSKGVVHRDVKPANIFIVETGHVKVIDFGIARLVTRLEGAAETVGSTVVGRPIGTPRYMAPERIRQLPPDPRSDLFSLGVVLFEMAAGVSPFAGATPAETITNILEKEPPSLTELAPIRPEKLGRIVGKLLAKPPEDRYQSAQAVCQDLRTVRTQGTLPSRLVDRLLRRPV